MNFNEYCQTLVNLEFEERVELGRKSFVKVYGALEAAGVNDENKAHMIDALIRAGVSGDMSCDEQEWKLYNAIFDADLSGDDFYNLTNGGSNPEFLNALDEIVDAFDAETKFAAVTLVGVFVSADDKLTPNEQGVLAKLLA